MTTPTTSTPAGKPDDRPEIIRTAVKLLFILAMTCPIAPANAQVTRHVDAAGNDQNGDNECTNASAPCLTIAHAMGKASNGDIVAVAGGVYTESLTIDKSLSFHGAGVDETVIQAHAEPGEADGRVMTISGEVEVEISGVTVRHGAATTGLNFILHRSGGGILRPGWISVRGIGRGRR